MSLVYVLQRELVTGYLRDSRPVRVTCMSKDAQALIFVTVRERCTVEDWLLACLERSCMFRLPPETIEANTCDCALLALASMHAEFLQEFMEILC